MKKSTVKKLSLILCFSITITLLAGYMPKAKAANASMLYSPVKDERIKASAWNTVYFGSYPTSEIVRDDGDVWYQLDEMSNNRPGEYVVNGERYRAITVREATYALSNRVPSGDREYPWVDGEYQYRNHYFKYEPIRWRVMSVDGDNAFLMAENVLDCIYMNHQNGAVTWSNSRLRSWLNGYDASSNYDERDFTSSNFINYAFTEDEISYIADSYLENKPNPYYNIEDNIPTTDKVFILSLSDCYGLTGEKYGFEYYRDERNRALATESTTFAWAMGAVRGENKQSSWWLRTKGRYDYYFSYITDGDTPIHSLGIYQYYSEVGVRPCININWKKAMEAGLLTKGADVASYTSSLTAGTPNLSVDDIAASATATPSTNITPKPTFPVATKPNKFTLYSPVRDKTIGASAWNTVYYGSYPTTEITRDDGDIWNAIEATKPDEQGNYWVDGVKYRAITYSDATTYTLSSKDSSYYSPEKYLWNDGEYVLRKHYFRYEPIRWRVMSVNGNSAFLFADKVLDCKKMNYHSDGTTWEYSFMRSWLNGYDANQNYDGTDCSNDNFIDYAFTPQEQVYIENTHVENKENTYHNISSGNDTIDKVYLLSMYDCFGLTGEKYCFEYYKESKNRALFGYLTTFAWAMGSFWHPTQNTTSYWLRTNGSHKNSYCFVQFSTEYFATGGGHQSDNNWGVRPCININWKEAMEAGLLTKGEDYACYTSANTNKTPELTVEGYTASSSATPSIAPTATPVVTVKPSATPTVTPIVTATPTVTPTTTPAATVAPSVTPTITPTIAPSESSEPTKIPESPTPEPSTSPGQTVSPTMEPSQTPVATTTPQPSDGSSGNTSGGSSGGSSSGSSGNTSGGSSDGFSGSTIPGTTVEPEKTAEPSTDTSPAPNNTPVPTDSGDSQGGTEQPTTSPDPNATNEPAPSHSPSEGTDSQDFDILKSYLTISNFKIKLNSNNKIVLSWSQNDKASMYQIFRSTKKKRGYALLNTVWGDKSKYTDIEVGSNKTYYYRIRAIYQDADSICIGDFSVIKKKKTFLLNKPVITVQKGITGQSIKYITITLKKYHGKYIDIYVKKKGKSYQKLKLTSHSIKKSKGIFRLRCIGKRTKYTLKVKTYLKKGKKRYYSGFSKQRSVKI